MHKPGDGILLMGPVKDRVGVLFPDLLGLRKPESHNMPSQGLMGILRISGIPMPLRIPMHNPSGCRNGGILPVHQGQVGDRVLNLPIAHISQQGYNGQVLGAHLSVETRYRLRRTSATAMHMHVARIPAGRLRPAPRTSGLLHWPCWSNH